MFVKKLMTTKVVTIGPEAPVTKAAKLMRDHNIGFLPITRNAKLVGVVTDRDICCRAVPETPDLSKVPVREIMSRTPVWCRDTETLEDAAHLMEEHGRQRLPILNHKDELVGVLSVADIATKMPHGFSGEVIEAVFKPAMTHMRATA